MPKDLWMAEWLQHGVDFVLFYLTLPEWQSMRVLANWKSCTCTGVMFEMVSPSQSYLDAAKMVLYFFRRRVNSAFSSSVRNYELMLRRSCNWALRFCWPSSGVGTSCAVKTKPMSSGSVSFMYTDWQVATFVEWSVAFLLPKFTTRV